MLPADVIGQVAVYKSPQADFEEGGIGGTIDVTTRNPLDLESMHDLRARRRAPTRTSRTNTIRRPPACSAGRTPTSTLGVLVAGIYQKRNIRRDGVEVLGYFDARSGAASAVLVPGLIGSALFQQERVRKGGNFARAVRGRPTTSTST